MEVMRVSKHLCLLPVVFFFPQHLFLTISYSQSYYEKGNNDQICVYAFINLKPGVSCGHEMPFLRRDIFLKYILKSINFV